MNLYQVELITGDDEDFDGELCVVADTMSVALSLAETYVDTLTDTTIAIKGIWVGVLESADPLRVVLVQPAPPVPEPVPAPDPTPAPAPEPVPAPVTPTGASNG